MPQPDHHNPSAVRSPSDFSAAGMLLKLVLLPGLLVAVLVGLTLRWATGPGRDVDAVVEQLAEGGRGRWPAAVNLAAVLHEDGNPALKRDAALARRLAEILRREIRAGRHQQQELLLRVYLCRLLGEFRIADPLPVLLLAATTQRTEAEVEVRCAALEAIAVLAFNVRSAAGGELRDHPGLLPGLLAAAAAREQRVREAAAFTLGVIGGRGAQDRLDTMLADEAAEVRYNAATGLARHGNPKCIDVLLEMLDAGASDARQDPRRAIVLRNALEAVDQLAAASPGGQLDRLREPVERLARGPAGARIRVKAREALHRLQQAAGR